jgi:hypothetical protein
LWRDLGKHAQARDPLAPIYGWFTKGFDTLDLKEAEALRSSVTVKRRAETALLMLGGCMPLCVWCNWKRRRSFAVAVSGDRPTKPRMLGRFAHRRGACPP